MYVIKGKDLILLAQRLFSLLVVQGIYYERGLKSKRIEYVSNNKQIVRLSL